MTGAPTACRAPAPFYDASPIHAQHNFDQAVFHKTAADLELNCSCGAVHLVNRPRPRSLFKSIHRIASTDPNTDSNCLVEP